MTKEQAIEILTDAEKFFESMDAGELFSLDEEIEAFKMAIEALKQKPEWIPVSERLPEEDTDVLVTRKFLGIKDVPESTYVEIANHIDGYWTACSDEYKVARSRHSDPIAWMPLPECYRGEKDDE